MLRLKENHIEITDEPRLMEFLKGRSEIYIKGDGLDKTILMNDPNYHMEFIKEPTMEDLMKVVRAFGNQEKYKGRFIAKIVVDLEAITLWQLERICY